MSRGLGDVYKRQINTLTDDEDENMKKTIEISVTIYKALIQAADALEPVLEDTLAKL